jgi:hypothetical protein
MTVIPGLGRLRHDGHEIEARLGHKVKARLGYKVRLCLKKQNKTRKAVDGIPALLNASLLRISLQRPPLYLRGCLALQTSSKIGKAMNIKIYYFFQKIVCLFLNFFFFFFCGMVY